jgi:ABC-2 type transport system permease protein
MSFVRIWKFICKDLRLGPRSPIFLWALAFPFVMTLVVQVVFGNLFTSKPRLGIVDKGNSQIKDNDLDTGIVLKEGFDQAVNSGHKPLLEAWISGESLASNRIIIAVTTLDLIRNVEGKLPLVDIEIHSLGDSEALSISSSLTPLLVFFALLISGVFVTPFGLVEERENKTLNAVLVTPLRFSDVLIAKAGVGMILALLTALITLLLNRATGSHFFAIITVLLVAALMSVVFGLIYGTIAKDTKSLFTLVKTLNLFLVAPMIFFLFPNLPQWIAKIFPTYWIINPIFEIAINDGGFSEVAPDLMVALVFITVLIFPVIILSRRMKARLSAT